MSNEPSETKPSTGMATLLGVICPMGSGHLYLGHPRRALLWLVIPAGVGVLLCAALPWLGGAMGYGFLFWSLLGGALLAWIASLVDLRRIPAVSSGGRSRANRVFAYVVLGYVFTFGIRGLIKRSLLESFKVPNAGMAPSVMPGDHIIADKLVFRSRSPKRGEPIVFHYPERPEQDFVKRVIAVPGDTLDVVDGHPRLNGWLVPSCLVGKATLPDGADGTSSGEVYVEFLEDEAYLTFFDKAAMPQTQGPFPVVGQSEVWVMGDNRNNSHDSRMWFGGQGGGVPLDLVIGRALFRWLNVSNAGIDGSSGPLAKPRLPASMGALEPALEACLAKRPPRAQTTPPR